MVDQSADASEGYAGDERWLNNGVTEASDHLTGLAIDIELASSPVQHGVEE